MLRLRYIVFWGGRRTIFPQQKVDELTVGKIWKIIAPSKERGIQLPSLHSLVFAQLREPTFSAGVKTLVTCVIDLMR